MAILNFKIFSATALITTCLPVMANNPRFYNDSKADMSLESPTGRGWTYEFKIQIHSLEAGKEKISTLTKKGEFNIPIPPGGSVEVDLRPAFHSTDRVPIWIKSSDGMAAQLDYALDKLDFVLSVERQFPAKYSVECSPNIAHVKLK